MATHPSDPATGSQGAQGSAHPAALIGGGLLGFVANGFLFLMAFLIAWSLSVEGEPGPAGRDFAIMLGGSVLLPLVCAAIVFRRGSPQVGRGFVLGVGIGALVVAALALPWFFGV